MPIDGASVYIVLCADASYYTGSTRKDVETRVSEHNLGINADYTTRRRPVKLVWSAHFERITDAIAMERQIKGWSRAKKEALIRGDYDALPALAAKAQQEAVLIVTANGTPAKQAVLILRSVRSTRLEGRGLRSRRFARSSLRDLANWARPSPFETQRMRAAPQDEGPVLRAELGIMRFEIAASPSSGLHPRSALQVRLEGRRL